MRGALGGADGWRRVESDDEDGDGIVGGEDFERGEEFVVFVHPRGHRTRVWISVSRLRRDSLALLLRACESSSEEYDEDTIDNIESALQAMEFIITSCQSGVQDAEKTAPRVDLALKFLSYDPNLTTTNRK